MCTSRMYYAYEKIMFTHRVWYGMYFSCCGLAWLIHCVVTQRKICPGPRFSCMSPLQVSSNRTSQLAPQIVDGFVQNSGNYSIVLPQNPSTSHSHPIPILFPSFSPCFQTHQGDFHRPHLDTPHFCGLFTLGAERPSCASTDGKSLWMMDVSIKHTTKISVILSIHTTHTTL